jgi:hypothetical protein
MTKNLPFRKRPIHRPAASRCAVRSGTTEIFVTAGSQMA